MEAPRRLFPINLTNCIEGLSIRETVDSAVKNRRSEVDLLYISVNTVEESDLIEAKIWLRWIIRRLRRTSERSVMLASTTSNEMNPMFCLISLPVTKQIVSAC